MVVPAHADRLQFLMMDGVAAVPPLGAKVAAIRTFVALAATSLSSPCLKAGDFRQSLRQEGGQEHSVLCPLR
jgi:hypothetical protein